LQGKLSEFYSCGCGYDCRIIFSIENIKSDEKVVILIDIGSHDDVY
jgi:mRNA-degrading endonuclease YafQ of YafQ-DinJ toxin-antitoxin module